MTPLPPEGPLGVTSGGAWQSARRPRLAHGLVQNIGLVLVAVLLSACLIAYCGIFYGTQGRFPGGFELTSTVNNAMPLAMASLAQTIVVVTRGIDLSVGGVVDLTNAVAAVTLDGSPATLVVWTVVILLIGALCGLVNGVLVAIGRLQPILVTLATLSIYQGLAIRVLPQPGGAIPPGYTAVLANTEYPVSLLFVPLIGLLWMALRRSRLGVAIFAIGNDAAAAASYGISVRRTIILAYTLGGTASGAAGLLLAASSTAGDATTGDTYTLTSIVAAVLGGVSLFGGRGSGVGALLGAFVTVMIVNILFFSQIDPLYQTFYEGLFLLVAVVAANSISRLVRGRR